MALIRARLPEKRLRHVLGVAALAVELAARFGLDAAKLETAALLHDLCRTISNEGMLERAEHYGLPIGALQRRKPMLLHGPVAAEECLHTLGITDPEIYEAIYWHTTGKPGLCRLGQALCLADFSEPNRDYPEAAQARVLLDTEGFDAALRYVAEQKARHAESKPSGADPNTHAFAAWLREGAHT
jgi:predicted HD superfamily hydrolase involved in NAD metabolism